MSEPYFIALYPMPGRELDFIAGLRAWLAADGKFEYDLAWAIDTWNPAVPECVPFYTAGQHVEFDTSDPGTIATFAAGRCAKVTLSASFYTPSIEVYYFPHAPADPLIEFVYHYPHRWGLGGDGLQAANNALFALARAAGAAYVLTSVTEGHYQMHRQFVPSDGGYQFILTDDLAASGHRMLAIDINPELGAALPVNTPTLCVEPMPCGYSRHWLRGHSPPEFSDDWPRLKRPGSRSG
ncbi:MAG: hypothetical protein LC104_04760 [Bacteroidales bacterium]|nr:hypothetical protein [Bacteroidales bacterium]